tara:strand:- start:505 stop:729 length:225 start_codon:yes stop_codon:yes gene_type:complete
MKKDRIERFLQTLLNLTGVVAIVYTFMIVSSCDDNIYIGGYNKDFEEISQLIFETDSLIMTIQKDLDSLNAKGY